MRAVGPKSTVWVDVNGESKYSKIKCVPDTFLKTGKVSQRGWAQTSSVRAPMMFSKLTNGRECHLAQAMRSVRNAND